MITALKADCIKILFVALAMAFLAGCSQVPKSAPKIMGLRFEVAPELKDHELNITIYKKKDYWEQLLELSK